MTNRNGASPVVDYAPPAVRPRRTYRVTWRMVVWTLVILLAAAVLSIAVTVEIVMVRGWGF